MLYDDNALSQYLLSGENYVGLNYLYYPLLLNTKRVITLQLF